MRFDIPPKTFRRYIDDSYAQFGSRTNATKFLNVLNSQNPHMQYTKEYENEHKVLDLLEATIKNNLNQSYDFVVYRKLAIANVHIKPHSNIYQNIAMGVFKEFFITCTTHLFRKLFSTIDRVFNKRFCGKWT